MSTLADRTGFTDWEREGENASPELDASASALVIGPNAVAAAEVALGIARVQARRRRVAVGDAVGELPPIESLLPTDSPYGLMDSFLYGVSLTKIAHAVDPAQNLYLLPSGVGPIDHEALLRSERWPGLVAGFKEAGALLLVIAPQDEDALSQLAPQMDGVVLVGDATIPAGSRVLAHVGTNGGAPESADAPAPAASAAGGVAAAAPPSTVTTPPEALPALPAASAAASAEAAPAPFTPAPGGTGARATPDAPVAVEPPAAAEAPAHTGGVPDDAYAEPPSDSDVELAPDGEIVAAGLPRWKPLWVAGVAAVLALVALLVWSGQRRRAPAVAAAKDTAASPAARAPAAEPATNTAAGTISSDEIQNVGDSAAAARYSVALAQVFSPTDANAWLEKDGVRGLPALTYAAESAGGSRTSYLVLTGAYVQRERADSLLRALRRSGVLRAQQGHVESLPVSLALYSGVPPDQAGYTIRGYRLNGVPLYPLAQGDGSVTLYVGAFPTAAAARFVAATLRRGGDQPRIVYRTGRAP